MALTRNKLGRLSNGKCLDTADRNHTDASVTRFDVYGDLCFSIGNLERVPPSSLLKEILSLVLHETTHLGGAKDEGIAIAWQVKFSDYFGERFGDLEVDGLSEQTLDSISEDRNTLSDLNAFSDQPQNLMKRGKLASALIQKLAMLPALFDPLALELKTKARHPELINNYLNSVFALIYKIKGLFDVVPQSYTHFGTTFMKISYEEEPQAPTKAAGLEAADLDQIVENFKAFVGTDPEAESTCVLPPAEMDISIFKKSLIGVTDPLRISFPPRVCDSKI